MTKHILATLKLLISCHLQIIVDLYVHIYYIKVVLIKYFLFYYLGLLNPICLLLRENDFGKVWF